MSRKLGIILEALKEAKRFHVGDHVGWNSEAGHVTGKVIKVHTKNFEVNGYTHHCTEDQPQYEIKSDKSDHIAYHKAGAMHRIPTKESFSDEAAEGVSVVSSGKEGENDASLEEPILYDAEPGTLSTEALPAHSFKTLKPGTHVTWPYRGTHGHGVINGVHKLGKTAGDTAYTIEQHDNHVSKSGSKEKKYLIHYGRVLTVTKGKS